MKKTKLLPYLLLLPSLIYLVLFFAYPMVESLQLAFRREGQLLNLRVEPTTDAAITGTLELQTEVTVLDRQKLEETLANGRTRPFYWFKVEGVDTVGQTAQGWVAQTDLFIESRTDSTTARVVSGQSTKEWTLDYVHRMLSDYRFTSALGTTLLLIVLDHPASVHPRDHHGAGAPSPN